MSWRDIQHSPIVFWVLAIITLISFVFGFYAWLDGRPSRQISYFQASTLLVNVADFGSSELALDGRRITEGSVYKNRLFIWNSGNRELALDDFGEPIQLSNAPAGFQWSDQPSKVDTIFHGIRQDQIDGDLLPGIASAGLRFKKLYPKTGLEIIFLTKSVPEISLSGSISGDTGSSGIIKRQKAEPEHFRSYVGWLWLIFTIVFIGMFWRSKRPTSWSEHLGYFIGPLILAGFPSIFLFQIGKVVHDYGLPPF
jgi:hypothetical protein